MASKSAERKAAIEERKAAKEQADRDQISSYSSRREEFEAGHPDRMAGVHELLGVSESSMSHRALYGMMHFTDSAPHPSGQAELPGMESVQTARRAGLLDPSTGSDHRDTLPDTVPVGYPSVTASSRAFSPYQPQPHQTRWEDLHPDDQAIILHKASKFGVTKESAGAAYGAQLDQSHVRARNVGAPEPAGMRFYTGYDPDNPEHAGVADPRTEIKDAAERQGVHYQTMSTNVALGSPRMEFGDYKKKDFPNIIGAEEYTHRGLAGQDPTATPVMRGTAAATGEEAKVAMLPERGKIIAHAATQMESGTLASDLTAPESGKHVLGDMGQQKVTAFQGGWVDPHGSGAFFTSDTHSGQAFAPHLGKKDLQKYLAIPGIKLLHDHAARQEHEKRGLNSTHDAQASQWAEQQQYTGQVKEGDMYKGFGSKYSPQQFAPLEGQRGLF